MKVYRFAVGQWDNGCFDLQCIDDASLFTQARSLDEAVVMARDVVFCMRNDANSQIALVVPSTFKVKGRTGPSRAKRAPQSNGRRRKKAA
jgi:hypothetical protein